MTLILEWLFEYVKSYEAEFFIFRYSVNWYINFSSPAKIRRLYDIANVLSSLDLIKKVHVNEERGRKPAFKWTGPEISPNPSGMYLFS